jgi:hypothetical protein
MTIDLSDIRVNCHFFTPEEIELDIDPSEVVRDDQADRVMGFISDLGRVLQKRVILTWENMRNAVVFEYLPERGTVEYLPPSSG